MNDERVIPTPIRRYLTAFGARRRHVALIRAIGLALASGLSWLLLVSVVDRLMPFPAWLRLVLTCINVTLIATIILRPLRALASRRINWIAAAAQVEERDPRFGGSLETAVSQLHASQAARGSEPMIDRIVAECTRLVGVGSGAALVPMQPALRPWICVVLICIVGSLLSLSSLFELSTLIQRQLRPYAPIGAVTTTRITVEPGSVEIAQGRSITITARATRLGNDSPIIRFTDEQGAASHRPMTQTVDGRFTYTFAQVDRDWQYQVSGGDAQSDLYTIRVLRQPGVSLMRVRYVYPDYIQQPSMSLINTDGALEAPVGSQAMLEIVCSEPVASAAVIVAGVRIIARFTSDPLTLEVAIPIKQSAPYQIALQSHRGIAGVTPTGTIIRAIPDQPPVVQWTTARRDVRLDPSDEMLMSYAIADDYGVVSSVFTVQVNDQPAKAIPLPAGGAARELRGKQLLLMPNTGARIGDVVRTTITARDQAGNQTISEAIRILCAPNSIHPDALACADELERAADIARRVVTESADVLSLGTQNIRARDLLVRHPRLAKAGELADELATRVLRAISLSHNPALCDALEALLDRVTMARSALRAASSAELSDRYETQLALAGAQKVPYRAYQTLITLAQSERARLIQADLRNIQALVALTPSGESGDELADEAIRSAGAELDQSLAELGIDPEDESLASHLEDWISAGDEVTASPGASDMQTADKARSLAAARAQMLRYDGDYNRALSLARIGQASSQELSVLQEAAGIAPLPVVLPSTQPAQLTALQVARRAARDGILTSPAIVRLLEASASTSSLASRAAQPPRPALQIPAPSGSVPVGYAEPIRLYLQLLQGKK